MKNSLLALGAAVLLLAAASCSNGNGSGDSGKAAEDITINVKSTREFLEAIGSNRTIVVEQDLSDLTAELTKMVKEGKVPEKGILEPIQPQPGACISATAMEEGYSLNIVSAENLTIAWGGKSKPKGLVVAEPSDANVMAFYHCKNVAIKHMAMEHKKQDGCTGDVVYLFGSQNISIDDCSLNGCGVIGVDAVKSQNVSVSKTAIYDCSAYGARLKDCDSVFFSECSIKQIGTRELDIYDSKRISLSKCEFERLDSLVSGNANPEDIIFRDCKAPKPEPEAEKQETGEPQAASKVMKESSTDSNIDGAVATDWY